MESGGTVLSTNWIDVGKRRVEMNPPDDVEFKKYWATLSFSILPLFDIISLHICPSQLQQESSMPCRLRGCPLPPLPGPQLCCCFYFHQVQGASAFPLSFNQTTHGPLSAITHYHVNLKNLLNRLMHIIWFLQAKGLKGKFGLKKKTDRPEMLQINFNASSLSSASPDFLSNAHSLRLLEPFMTYYQHLYKIVKLWKRRSRWEMFKWYLWLHFLAYAFFSVHSKKSTAILCKLTCLGCVWHVSQWLSTGRSLSVIQASV